MKDDQLYKDFLDRLSEPMHFDEPQISEAQSDAMIRDILLLFHEKGLITEKLLELPFALSFIKKLHLEHILPEGYVLKESDETNPQLQSDTQPSHIN